VIEPLSVAVVGEFEVEPPAFTEAPAYVTEGAVFAETLTVRFAVAVPLLPSVTVKTTVFAPIVALQSAATVAEIVPAALVMPVTVIPAGAVVAVTARLPTGVSPSPTVAIVLMVPAEPRCRLKAAPAVIVGRLLPTVSVKLASVVVPQLSVALIVIVCAPTGAAALMETSPAALTEIVPV